MLPDNLTPRQARVISEKTQQEVADALDICIQTYRKIEKKPELMTIQQARDFCNVVGFDVNRIFFCLKLQLNWKTDRTPAVGGDSGDRTLTKEKPPEGGLEQMSLLLVIPYKEIPERAVLVGILSEGDITEQTIKL